MEQSLLDVLPSIFLLSLWIFHSVSRAKKLEKQLHLEGMHPQKSFKIAINDFEYQFFFELAVVGGINSLIMIFSFNDLLLGIFSFIYVEICSLQGLFLIEKKGKRNLLSLISMSMIMGHVFYFLISSDVATFLLGMLIGFSCLFLIQFLYFFLKKQSNRFSS